MALHLLPVIVSPTTIRSGYKTRNIVKGTSEYIDGDAFFVGKYDIPSVDLAKCDEKLDFACLLAIGTTPINIQTKQLDGLVKTSTLLSVRPSGRANYLHLPGHISRQEIELVVNTTPEVIINKEVSVFVNNVDYSENLEGTLGVSVRINGEGNITEMELNGSLVSIKIDTTANVSSTVEGSLGVSVKIDGNIVSNSNEG